MLVYCISEFTMYEIRTVARPHTMSDADIPNTFPNRLASPAPRSILDCRRAL